MTKIMSRPGIRRVLACLLVLAFGLGFLARGPEAGGVAAAAVTISVASADSHGPCGADVGGKCGAFAACATASTTCPASAHAVLPTAPALTAAAAGVPVASGSPSGRSRSIAPDPFPPRPFALA